MICFFREEVIDCSIDLPKKSLSHLCPQKLRKEEGASSKERENESGKLPCCPLSFTKVTISFFDVEET